MSERRKRPKPTRRRLAGLLVTLAIAGLAAVPLAPLPSSATSPPEHTELATGMAGVHGEITRLYLALLDRSPEEGGLDYWASRRQDGASLRAVVAFFRNSPEFEARFGSMIGASTAEWVDFIYLQVLGRPSDPNGKSFWVQLIDSGSASKEDLIIHFSESPEFQTITGTGLVGFLDRVAKSENLYAAAGNSYTYTSDGSNYWARSSTTIVVRDGVVIERSFELDWDWDGDIDESWTETGDDIGSHESGEPAETIPQVHATCSDLLTTLDPIAHELSLDVDELGRVTACGGLHRQLADATDPMVEIEAFDLLS